MTDQTTNLDSTGAEQDTAVTQAEIKNYVERVLKLEDEKKIISDDIKDVYAEAKGRGFDVPALKTVVARTKKERAEVEELDSTVELYEQALGLAA